MISADPDCVFSFKSKYEGTVLPIDKFDLNMNIPDHAKAAYKAALKSGDLLALRSVLLSVCTKDDAAHIKTMLPMDLVLGL